MANIYKEDLEGQRLWVCTRILEDQEDNLYQTFKTIQKILQATKNNLYWTFIISLNIFVINQNIDMKHDNKEGLCTNKDIIY